MYTYIYIYIHTYTYIYIYIYISIHRYTSAYPYLPCVTHTVAACQVHGAAARAHDVPAVHFVRAHPAGVRAHVAASVGAHMPTPARYIVVHPYMQRACICSAVDTAFNSLRRAVAHHL